MNYKAVSNDICHLVEQMNTWSSTITIPQGDEYLDISSAAMENCQRHQLVPIISLQHFPKAGLLLSSILTPKYSMKING